MKVALNTSIELELMSALEEYVKQIGSNKSAVISTGLLKVIPVEILKKNDVKEI